MEVCTHLKVVAFLFHFNLYVFATCVSLLLGIHVLAVFLDASRLNSAN